MRMKMLSPVNTVLRSLFIQSILTFVYSGLIESKTWSRNSCHGSNCPGFASRSRKHCLDERTERLRLAELTQSLEYVPECSTSSYNNYSPVQCHPGTGACWCVTLQGKPIAGSTIFKSKPNCTRYSRTHQTPIARRSSTSSRKRKPRRACTYGDRAIFNTALVKTFRSEFNRVRAHSSAYENVNPDDDTVVLSWKFGHLDVNKDGVLHRNETDNLKRLVKQQISPRPCANSFIPHCAHRDKQITKIEWLECLQVGEPKQPSLSFDIFKSLVDSSSRGSLHPRQQFRPVPLSTGLVPPLSYQRNSDASLETNNCWGDRQSALASQQLDSNKSIIIPECTPDGKYQKLQCAHGRAYCWCVNDTTGLEIVETLGVNSLPNCDKLTKECLGKKRERFIQDILDMYINQNASSSGNRATLTHSRNLTLNEQVAKLNFERLDQNGNGFLDKPEWKVFKSETGAISKLKKCSKRFLKHCDANNDSKVSLTEWTNCLNLKRASHLLRRYSQRSSSGVRTGKNPFTTMLQK